MRTRKSNKTQRKSYAAAFRLASDESGEELDETQDQDADVDFGENEGEEASDEEEIEHAREDHTMNGDNVSEEIDESDDQGTGAQETDGGSVDYDDSDEVSLDETPTRRGRKLPRRVHVHEVPTYPADLRATRIYDGPLKRQPRGPELLNLLYGPDPDHIKIFRGMLRKWFDHQILPSGRVGERGVMSSPWLAEDFEEKQKYWSRTWHERYRAAKLQRLRKIRPDHVDMFKPSMDELVCFVGQHHHQKQIRTCYGHGQSVAENGQPLDTVDPGSQEATKPKEWLLDTGGIPLAIGWAPLTGHKDQFLAVCSVPFSDQEAKDGSSLDADPEEKKKGSVQIWSLPCHRTDGSEARLAQFLTFDWGRPRRLQWCPVPPPDDSNIGLLAVLTADGLVRVIEVPKATWDQEIYGMSSISSHTRCLLTLRCRMDRLPSRNARYHRRVCRQSNLPHLGQYQPRLPRPFRRLNQPVVRLPSAHVEPPLRPRYRCSRYREWFSFASIPHCDQPRRWLYYSHRPKPTQRRDNLHPTS